MDLLPWEYYVVFSLIAAALLLAVAFGIYGKASARNPSRFQIGVELLLDNLRDLFSGSLGEGAREHLPLVLTFFLYIGVSNLLGLVPVLRSPTAASSTTIGLGLITFFYVQYIGIKSNGLVGYLKHFMGPVLVLAPMFIVIEIIGELAKPFSLGMRLFGNIYGEDIVKDLTVKGGVLAVPLQLAVNGLQLFTDLIQPLIFAMLTSAYISIFSSSHHQDSVDISHENENNGDIIGRIPAQTGKLH
jgi:F-type H+-transporting ATPase subunit a